MLDCAGPSGSSSGDVIEGTGGVRKVRFAGRGWGKRGGYRVITFFSGTDIPVFLLNSFAKSEKSDLAVRPGKDSRDLQAGKGVEMKKSKPTAGERMIESAGQTLAFAKGRKNRGCEVHVPDDVDVKAIREKISLSQGEFAKLFGLSKRTLEHWEHGRRVPSGPARAFLTVIAREPDAVRRALLA
ncbi:MAG TPA: helix-turn-helix domain-containing protein [Bryobacteraceae bacterium]|nr:helix-turn-helix domain-containing protein [Bryobacteraceae bacterium]